MKLLPILAFALMVTGANAQSPVIATLGDVALTELDIDAALLDIPPDIRPDVAADTKKVGEILEGILIRRAIVAQADSLLPQDQIESLSREAHEKRMLGLILEEQARRAIDDTAVRIRANELFADFLAAWRPYDLLDSETLSVSSELGWNEAEALAQELSESWRENDISAERLVLDNVPESQQEHIVYSQAESQDVRRMEAQFLAVLDTLQAGDVGTPVADTQGYHVIRINKREPARAPRLSDAEQDWLDLARQELLKENIEQLGQGATPEALWEWAEEKNFQPDPARMQYVQHSQERAILEAYKNTYVERELAGRDFNALARERYLTGRDRYRTRLSIDYYSVQVGQLGGETYAAIENALEERVKEEGASALVAIMEDLAGGRPMRIGTQRIDTDMNEFPASTRDLILERLEEGKTAGVYGVRNDITGIYAVENYQPSRQLTFDEVAEDLTKELSQSAAGRLWDLHKAEFSSMPVTLTDPEALLPGS